MEPPLFRSTDNASGTEHVYHRPDELIGFADLLLRWPSLAFFKVPFFTIMRRVGDDFGFYLHLYEAKSIAFSDILPEGVSETATEAPFEKDGSQKPRRKNAAPRQKTAAELEADRMHIYLRFQTPFYFRNRFKHLYDNFGKLYFLRSEVEAIEKAHLECRITSPLTAGKDSPYSGLYITTEKNIAEVAYHTLIRMAFCESLPVQYPGTFRDGLLSPDTAGWWVKSTEPLYQEDDTDTNGIIRISPLPVLPDDSIWPDIPVILPEKTKKKRTVDLRTIWPKVAVLKRLGIRDNKKLAKIIFFLHPFLNDEYIGTLFPAKPGTDTVSGTKRQWGRELLGKKRPRKPTQRKPETDT